MELGDKYEGVLNLINKILDFKLFEINHTPVTISSIVLFVVVIMLFYIISRLLNRIILKRILGKFNIDQGILADIIILFVLDSVPVMLVSIMVTNWCICLGIEIKDK